MKATAQVNVTLQITLTDTWGKDCTIFQAQDQAKASALNIIHQQITSSMKNIKVLGEPESIIIIMEG
ncbi:MAG TPA: hypothetical protein VMV86_06900 [Methanosarcinales archaeon]|nr:hypothetical protein [Methanosarcinales archaeon]